MSGSSLFSTSPFQPEQLDATQVHNDLLQWYAAEMRALPWRMTSDPYAILVSEIMLQQTQVDRVLPKYQQFLAAFPTLADLATAATADKLTIKNSEGNSYDVTVTADSRVMKDRQPIKLSDVNAPVAQCTY